MTRQETLSFQGSLINSLAGNIYACYKHGAYESRAEHVTGIHTLMEECHTRSLNAGWYTDPRTGKPLERNLGEMIALMHSEVSEMSEGVLTKLPSDKLIGYSAEEEEAADILIRLCDYAGYRNLALGRAVNSCLKYDTDFKVSSAVEMIVVLHCEFSNLLEGVRKKGPGNGSVEFSFEEESAARAFIQLMAYSEHQGLRLDTAYIAKLKYNESRADHKLKNRAKPDGKAF